MSEGTTQSKKFNFLKNSLKKIYSNGEVSYLVCNIDGKFGAINQETGDEILGFLYDSESEACKALVKLTELSFGKNKELSNEYGKNFIAYDERIYNEIIKYIDRKNVKIDENGIIHITGKGIIDQLNKTFGGNFFQYIIGKVLIE